MDSWINARNLLSIPWVWVRVGYYDFLTLPHILLHATKRIGKNKYHDREGETKK